jgi:hypothetical protein
MVEYRDHDSPTGLLLEKLVQPYARASLVCRSTDLLLGSLGPRTMPGLSEESRPEYWLKPIRCQEQKNVFPDCRRNGHPPVEVQKLLGTLTMVTGRRAFARVGSGPSASSGCKSI